MGEGGGPPPQRQCRRDSKRLARLRRARPENRTDQTLFSLLLSLFNLDKCLCRHLKKEARMEMGIDRQQDTSRPKKTRPILEHAHSHLLQCCRQRFSSAPIKRTNIHTCSHVHIYSNAVVDIHTCSIAANIQISSNAADTHLHLLQCFNIFHICSNGADRSVLTSSFLAQWEPLASLG